MSILSPLNTLVNNVTSAVSTVVTEVNLMATIYQIQDKFGDVQMREPIVGQYYTGVNFSGPDGMEIGPIGVYQLNDTFIADDSTDVTAEIKTKDLIYEDNGYMQ